MDDLDLTQALRDALGAAGSNWQQQPSILRRRLEQVLAHDAPRHRGRIHQLVVAADEKVPGRLVQKGGDRDQRHELAVTLAATRGWTPWAADWAVTTWAAALGLTTDVPPSGPPRDHIGAGPTEMPGLPGTQLPGTQLPGTQLPGTELPPTGPLR